MRFDWVNILVGVICIVVAGMLVGWLVPMLALDLPSFVYTALAALLGILVWFAIMPRLKR
jgi:xanthosine utilization system XapX-like protein